jgi:hypothetical protein
MKSALCAIIAASVLAAPVPSAGQSFVAKISISGAVIDDPGMLERMSFPIENVMVKLWRMDITQPAIAITATADDSAITDSNGRYKLSAVGAVPYKLTFEHKDYMSISVDITTSRDTSVNVQMSKKDPYSGNQLIVTPSIPSTKDSIHFELIMSDHCCGTVYRDQKVDITDTSVVLNFTFDERLCPEVMCFTNISSTTFVSKPIKTGTYKVYKSGQLYCPPGSACPAIYYMPVLVGTLTVTNGTGTVHIQPEKKTVPYVISKNDVQFNGIRNSQLSIDCFTLSGAFAGSLYNGILKRENASVSLTHPLLDRLNQKTVVLRISLDGVVRSELLRK